MGGVVLLFGIRFETGAINIFELSQRIEVSFNVPILTLAGMTCQAAFWWRLKWWLVHFWCLNGSAVIRERRHTSIKCWYRFFDLVSWLSTICFLFHCSIHFAFYEGCDSTMNKLQVNSLSSSLSMASVSKSFAIYVIRVSPIEPLWSRSHNFCSTSLYTTDRMQLLGVFKRNAWNIVHWLFILGRQLFST